MNRLRTIAVSVRDSFWFFAALCTAMAVVLSELLVAIGRAAPIEDLGWGYVLLSVGADGSRSLLGAIATSMLGAAATMFSITIAVLALTSSTYGPRLVRNFLADRGNQFVLGYLVATAVYALLVLRHIRVLDLESDDSAFVPHLAVNAAVLLAIVAVGCLVYFIHHISVSIQVSTLSTRVRVQIMQRVDDLYPEDSPANVQDRATPLVDDPVGRVTASTDGYVTGIDQEGLLRAARKTGVVLEMACRPGAHRLKGEALALVGAPPGTERSQAEVTDELVEEVRSAVLQDTSRTPYQDVEFLVSQHVDLVVRALSPGTNDPLTAVNALDDLAAGLGAVAARPRPGNTLVDEDGRAWVRVQRQTAEDLAVYAIDHVRPYLGAHPDVVLQCLALLGRVGEQAQAHGTSETLLDVLDSVVEQFELTESVARDRRRVLAGADDVRARLRAGAGSPSGRER